MTKTAVNGQTTRVEEAYLVLSNAIVSQRFPQGTWLRQRTIAAELGMSPTPLMQAFQRLHHEGLVECVPQWGVRVRTFNVHDLRHLYEMRISLESMVCRELAVRLDDVESAVRDLCSLAEEVDRADETLRLNVLKGIEHLGATLEIDQQFHSALAELSGLNLVKREIDRLLLFPVTFQDFFPREQSASIRHVDLLETILTGDPVEAERVVRDSIDSVATPTLSCLAEEFGEGPIIFPQETSQDMREAIG